MTRRGGLVRLAPLGVCLLLIALLTAISPPEDEIPRHYVDARIGQPAANQQFGATVTEVQVGQELIKSEYEAPVHTTAVFLVVSLTASSPEESALYNAIDLQTTDGRTYAARDEFTLSHPKSTQPGFRTNGTVIFEVPADRIDGAQVIIAPDAASFRFYTSVIRVDLGLTSDTPYAPGPITLAEATSEVIR
jgi:hypothetical protein